MNKSKTKNYKTLLIYLIGIFGALFFIGIDDAISTTTLYNNLDIKNQFYLKIENKEEITEKELFLTGKLLRDNSEYRLKVNRGEYEEKLLDDTIGFYKAKSGNKTMTNYQIKNHQITHIRGKGYSIIFLFAIGSLIISIISLFLYIKTK